MVSEPITATTPRPLRHTLLTQWGRDLTCSTAPAGSDSLGRRGVVFLSLEATRLLPVLVSRQWPRIPYTWSKMSMERDGAAAAGTEPLRAGEQLTYVARRRWPAPRGARSRITVEVGETIQNSSERGAFLTARWGLHTRTLTGRARYLPNAHRAWTLREATVLELDDEPIAATGLPQPSGPPESVLVTDGVPVLFGGPLAPPPA